MQDIFGKESFRNGKVMQIDIGEHSRSFWNNSHLNNLINEPRNGLKLHVGNVTLQRLHKNAKVRIGQFHSGEKIGNDSLEEGNVLRKRSKSRFRFAVVWKTVETNQLNNL